MKVWTFNKWKFIVSLFRMVCLAVAFKLLVPYQDWGIIVVASFLIVVAMEVSFELQ